MVSRFLIDSVLVKFLDELGIYYTSKCPSKSMQELNDK